MNRFPQYLGACRVLLTVDQETARWGEEVTGTCTLLGGQSEQRVCHIQAGLVVASTEGGAPLALPRSLPAVWTDLRVPAREKVELAFALPVPVDSLLGTPVRVQLTVRLPELWGQGTYSEHVTLEPSTDYTKLAEVAAALAGLRVGAWRTLGGGDGLGVHLHPEPRSEAPLDGLELQIFRGKGGFHGELIVDPTDVGVGGRLKGLAGLDRVHYPFGLPRGDYEEAVRQFEHLLRPYIHPNRQHPLPSQAPSVEVATLPVPADRGRKGGLDLPRSAAAKQEAG